MPDPCRPRARAAVAAVFSLATLAACFPVSAARIVVVEGAQTPRLDATLAALRAHAAAPVEVVSLSTAGPAVRAEWARAERGSVLVALGPVASDAIVRMGLPGPIVHCLAGPDALRAGASSVPSDVPADQQAAWLARLVPGAKTVGLLFDPALNTRPAEAKAAAFGLAGYRAMMQPVASPAALPAALDQLAGRADVVVALRDSTVYASEAARGLLLYSFRKRIPIVGTSEAWVKRGALYAIDWDYAEVGATCAALAAREASPKAVAVAPVPPPRPRVFVNPKSAAHFGLAWSDELLRQVEPRHE